MGYWLGPGRAQHARSRRVRAPRPRASSGPGRPLRAAGDERARGGALPRPRAPAGGRPSRRRRGPSRRGHDPAPRAFRLFAARDLRTPRATDDDGPRLDGRRGAARPALRRGLRAPAAPRLRRASRADPRPLGDPGGPQPAAAHRLDRLRVLERQRGRGPAGLEPRAARARGRGRGRDSGGRRSTTSAFPSAVRRRSSLDLSGVRLGPSRRLRLVTNMRVYWDRIALGAPGRACALEPPAPRRRCAPTSPSAASRPRSTPDGDEPFGYDYARVVPAVALEVPARALHAAGRRARAARDEPTTCSWCRGPATRWRCPSTPTRLAAAARGLDPHLPALRRRLQQGDGHQLLEPGRGGPAALPRHEVLPVSARGGARSVCGRNAEVQSRYDTRVVGRTLLAAGARRR